MSSSEESECSLTLRDAFSGIGVDERSLITGLGKYRQEQQKLELTFQSKGRGLLEDDGDIEGAKARFERLFKAEIVRFQNAVMMWVMDPCVRDARLVRNALTPGPQAYDVILEVACTRSSGQLLAARKSYHSLFDRSIEEDIVDNVDCNARKLLLALVSSYRYEGQRVSEEVARSEADTLFSAIEKGAPSESDEVVNIIAIRSKHHLKAICNYFLEISGSSIYNFLDTDLNLKNAIQCLCTPETYYTSVLGEVLNEASTVGEISKEALTRVIVTQAGEGMEAIRNQYSKLHGAALPDMIQEQVKGNYKDFLLELVAE